MVSEPVKRRTIIDRELAALAKALAKRRDALLQAWNDKVMADPELTSAGSLPRAQFYDHIPDILDAYQQRLRTWSAEDSDRSRGEREDASSHGLQRWQQGYQLREVTREWGHLHVVMADEIEQLTAQRPEMDRATVAIARRVLLLMINDGVAESTAQYFRLREIEADGYARDLQLALSQLASLEQRRAELWRQAAHDLRGNLGIVVNATAGLGRPEVPEETREQFVRFLQRSVQSLQTMLDDMMSLARLQAGREVRQLAPLDAAALMRDLVDAFRMQADQRGLYLRVDGPDVLTVEGDATKIRRIAQNLLINALHYTEEGGISLTFRDTDERDADRWVLAISDTGPGFHAGPGAPLTGALEAATEEAQQLEARAESNGARHPPQDIEAHVARDDDPRAVRQRRGEGIGLAIVKRLCELLDASVEVETKEGEGTTFRVVFPRHYATHHIG
jgi:signal transduction histidine kinase